MKRRSQKKTSTLVIEQRGLSVVLAGLLIAALVSFTLRALFSPDRIKFEIEQAISQANTEYQVTLESALLSFNDGFFPRLAIVVNNLQLRSDNPCMGKPHSHIDRLHIPVSMRILWSRELSLNAVQIEKASLLFRSQIEKCSSPLASEREKSIAVDPNLPLSTDNLTPIIPITAASNQPIVKTLSVDRAPVSSVFVREFVVRFSEHPEVYISFEDLRARSHSTNQGSRWEVDGALLLGAKGFSGESMARTDFNMVLTSDEVMANIKGAWREGQIQATLIHDRVTSNTKQDIVARQLPVKQILPILKHYKFIDGDISQGESWLSFNALILLAHDQRKFTVNLKDLRIEGDLGEIGSNEVNLSGEDSKIKTQDFALNFSNVKLNSLLTYMGAPPWLFNASQFGLLSGSLVSRNPNSYTLLGQVLGGDLYFYGREKREKQTLERFVLKVTSRDTQIDLQIQDIKLSNKSIPGYLAIKFDFEKNSGSGDLSLQDWVFAPAVQKIIAPQGEISPMSIRGSFSFSNNHLEKVNLQGQLDSFSFDNISLSKLQLKMQQSDGSPLKAHLQAQKIELANVRTNANSLEVFKPLLNQTDGLLNKFERAEVHLDFFADGSLAWSKLKLHAATPKGSRIEGEGGWDSSGVLSGDFKLYGGGRSRSYILSGNRNQAIVEEKEK